MSKTELAVAADVKVRSKSRRTTSRASEPLDIYLREVESHALLSRDEERELLGRLVQARDDWAVAFLHSEGALEMVWQDLQSWKAEEIAGSGLVPGPPRLKPGQIGPDDHLRRVFALFERFVARHPKRPFHYQRRRQTKRLVRTLLFVGFRPRPLERYRSAAIKRHGSKLSARVERARDKFVSIRQPLVEKNLRLVLKVAWGYIPGPMTFDELIQEGNIGLLRATESFNRRFSVRFSTYAYLWIRQSVIRALEEKSRMIRLPVHLTHLLRKVARERVEGEPLPEVMRYQGKRYRLPKILANPTVTGGMVSLDSARADEDSGLADIIPDRDAPAPESRAQGDDSKAFIKKTVGKLPERLRKIVKLRFGIGCKRPHTLGEIGEIIGVSSERIRQLQEEALRALREGPDGEILEDLSTA